MCGLAGFVRHPRGSKFGTAKDIATDLLFEIRHRGKHAIGVAAVGKSSCDISKWATEPAKVLTSDVWGNLVRGFDRNTRIILGHVRHATLPNAGEDAAAHPYLVGDVVGAHNGIITNWKKLEKEHDQTDWITDSYGAFFHINSVNGKPKEAIKGLAGSFALTWARDGNLFMVRSSERPLACAYVGGMKTLFWASEKKALRDVLERYDLTAGDYAIWEAKPGTLYTFDPNKFDENSANGTKTACEVPQPDQQMDLRWSGAGDWSERTPQDTTDYSRRDKPRKKVGQDSLRELAERLNDLEDRVDALEMENTYLNGIIEENGLLDLDPHGPRDTDRCQPDFPFAAPTSGVCAVCKKGGAKLALPEGGWIHQDCVFGKAAR